MEKRKQMVKIIEEKWTTYLPKYMKNVRKLTWKLNQRENEN